jgi:hypothetical protein
MHDEMREGERLDGLGYCSLAKYIRYEMQDSPWFAYDFCDDICASEVFHTYELRKRTEYEIRDRL